MNQGLRTGSPSKSRNAGSLHHPPGPLPRPPKARPWGPTHCSCRGDTGDLGVCSREGDESPVAPRPLPASGTSCAPVTAGHGEQEHPEPDPSLSAERPGVPASPGSWPRSGRALSRKGVATCHLMCPTKLRGPAPPSCRGGGRVGWPRALSSHLAWMGRASVPRGPAAPCSQGALRGRHREQPRGFPCSLRSPFQGTGPALLSGPPWLVKGQSLAFCENVETHDQPCLQHWTRRVAEGPLAGGSQGPTELWEQAHTPPPRLPSLSQTPGRDHQIIYCSRTCAPWAGAGLHAQACWGAGGLSSRRSVQSVLGGPRSLCPSTLGWPGSGGTSFLPSPPPSARRLRGLRRGRRAVAHQDSRHLQLMQPAPPSSGGLSLRTLCCRISRTSV